MVVTYKVEKMEAKKMYFEREKNKKISTKVKDEVKPGRVGDERGRAEEELASNGAQMKHEGIKHEVRRR